MKLKSSKNVVLVNPGYLRKNRYTLYCSIRITVVVFLFAVSISVFSEFPLNYHTAATIAYAQPYLDTVKDRNLTLDLGNGLTTNAQLTIPAEGKGPFPGIIIFPGAGAGSVLSPTSPYSQLADYFSERGFVVLKYDKRGVGPNFTITDSNAWGNLTFDNLKQDAEKALSVILQQPEVNSTKRVTLIGHSEGTNIPPRVAVDNPDKVGNIVLMAPVGEKWTDIIYFQEVAKPLLYAENVLGKDHPGQLSVAEASKDPIFKSMVDGNLTQLLYNQNQTNITDNSSRNGTISQQIINTNKDLISIEDELKPALVSAYKNDTSPNASLMSAKCINIFGCPSYGKSFSALGSVNSMIGNVSSDTGILILVGENDSQTPREQALLLQQRLSEVNHPDHLIITYPNLGHTFVTSNQWVSSYGPMKEYVFQDIFEWLISHPRVANQGVR
ncbi:MAG TPA: alpha/beta fold hydrolase [Candidatus Nitrosocosmicus sp.]|nr:alpha/beta fold hydrolase [Candidatus Nitrosocosmicus sp.]